MDASKIQITGAFEEYGFWVEYTAPKVLQSNATAKAHVQLFIGESKLGGDRPFISGIGQAAGQILKVHIRVGRSKYFFMSCRERDKCTSTNLGAATSWLHFQMKLWTLGPEFLECDA